MVDESFTTETASAINPASKTIRFSTPSYAGISSYQGLAIFPTQRGTGTIYACLVYSFDGSNWVEEINWASSTNGLTDIFESEDGLLNTIRPEGFNRFNPDFSLNMGLGGFGGWKGAYDDNKFYRVKYNSGYRFEQNLNDGSGWTIVDDTIGYYFQSYYDGIVYLTGFSDWSIYKYDGTTFSLFIDGSTLNTSKRSYLYRHNDYFYFVDGDKKLWRFKHNVPTLCLVHTFPSGSQYFGFAVNSMNILHIHAAYGNNLQAEIYSVI